jgi:hypothetical protein
VIARAQEILLQLEAEGRTLQLQVRRSLGQAAQTSATMDNLETAAPVENGALAEAPQLELF